jgi:hypothetical protein
MYVPEADRVTIDLGRLDEIERLPEPPRPG